MASAMPIVVVDVPSSGLTTSTTGYSIGDGVGGGFAIDMTVGAAVLQHVRLIDESDVIGAMTLHLYDASITYATDNAAPSISDADQAKYIGSIDLPYATDDGGSRKAVVDSLAALCKAASGTTIYGYLQTQTAHTFFGATTALKLRCEFLAAA